MRVDVELSAATNTIVVVVVARPGRAVVSSTVTGHGLALVRRLVEARQHALHYGAGAHLHAGEAGQRLGVEQHAAGEDLTDGGARVFPDALPAGRRPPRLGVRRAR